MFIDELTLNIWAGKGGDGIVSWMHVKGLSHAGPGGGDGGKGGSVYLQGVHDIGALSRHRFIKDFNADNGDNGHGDCMHGKSGSDITIELPIGSVVTNTATLEFIEVLSAEPIFFLKGGWGGRGNNYFKGSKNVNPQESTVGKPGEGGEFFIELKLMVDLGLIGLPNAGKSSILNALTKAKAKIGSYQFTTLTPNLGDLYGFIIADIPGLIEGASLGKGLGIKFLRHVERTKILFHLISVESENPAKDYKTVRKELRVYNKDMMKKPEYLFLSKSDMIPIEKVKKKIAILRKLNKNAIPISIHDWDSLEKVKKILNVINLKK